MSKEIIGREEEKNILEELLHSKNSEFLAIYGRRRVGKTLLIREFFKEKKNVIFLNTTGTLQGSLKDQTENFTFQVAQTFYHGAPLKGGNNWNETFRLLSDAIKTVADNQKIVLFFDEFPWMATKNSKLLQNLDYYWNQHWSEDSRIKLIICGSSASFIINKIIKNKGGLHNRITRKIHLEPYNLRDTKRYLNYQGIKLSNQQITQLYMALGGVPYYLSYVEKGMSATQNLEKMAFRPKSFLMEEFNNLFSALFDDPDVYINIVRTIAKYRYGIEQEELFVKIKELSKGGRGAERLKALEDASFIIRFKPHFHSKKGIYYKVIDEYTLFYFNWIEPLKETLIAKGTKKNYWDSIQSTAEWHSWSGYAFEAVCYKHILQIGNALKLSPTALATTWKYSPVKEKKEEGAQIDLLFDRKDNTITICEIKYTNHPFEISKQYSAQLQRKIEIFKNVTKTRKNIFLAMIAANGVKENIYHGMVDNIVTLDDLFKNKN